MKTEIQCVIKMKITVWNLWVNNYLDSESDMRNINKISIYHLKNVTEVRPFLSKMALEH